MSFRDKPGRRRAFFIKSATVNFEKPVAGSALKVMMMLLSRSFVKCDFFRRTDFFQPAVFDKNLEISIDSRLVQCFDGTSTFLQDFMDTQRSVNSFENVLNGVPLVGLSFHPSIHQLILAFRKMYCKGIRAIEALSSVRRFPVLTETGDAWK
jgi:hypothetical protein